MLERNQQLALFRNWSYNFYAVSALLAMISYGMNYIALTWIVLHYEGGGVKPVVILMLCFLLPSVFLSPFSGVIVDRINRRKLFIFMSWSRGLLLFILGYIEWAHPSLVAIYIIATIEGAISTPVLPTVSALVREIVSEQELLVANTTIDMVYETGNVIGMALAGFAIAWLSNAGAIMAAGILFFVATLFAYGIKTPYRTTVEKKITIKAILDDLFNGFIYIIKRTEIKVMYTLELLALVIYMVVPVLTAPFAHKYLHANVTQFGYLEALLSVGAVIGNVVSPVLVRHLGLLTMMIIYNVILVVCFLLFSMNRGLPEAYLLNFFIGIGFASWALIMTRAQEVTDIDYQGRVSSSFGSLSSIAMLLVYAVLYFEGPTISLSHLYWIQVMLAATSLFLLTRYYMLFKR